MIQLASWFCQIKSVGLGKIMRRKYEDKSKLTNGEFDFLTPGIATPNQIVNLQI
jgi:hypothetical protein